VVSNWLRQILYLPDSKLGEVANKGESKALHVNTVLQTLEIDEKEEEKFIHS